MSALLSMSSNFYGGINEIKWKGKTMRQLIPTIQLNYDIYTNKNLPKVLTLSQLRRPLPLKIYRKEIAIVAPPNCNARVSTKITDLDMPGSTVFSETKTYTTGLALSAASEFTTIQGENPGSCTSCFSPVIDAKRRCRSAGMIPKKFNVNNNNSSYSTSTNQYLVSRNRTIKQNEYNYIRQGNSGLEPGTGLSKSNIYSPSGLSHCYQPQISAANNNNVFQYMWIDGATYTVTIPDGLYDVNGLNNAFQTVMLNNKHYFILISTGAPIFLLSFSYNTSSNTVLIKTEITPVYRNTNSYSGAVYSVPIGNTWATLYWVVSPVPIFPANTTSLIILSTNTFQNIVGFIPGTYAGPSNNSVLKPKISTNYVTLYYKPSNPEFGVQGAVDSSTYMHRRKYNTITNAAASTASVFSSSTANALSYGVSEVPYTAKAKKGYSVNNYPVINKYTGKLECNSVCPRRIRRG